MGQGPTVKRAAIYARISLDRTGAGLGIDRQIEDCLGMAKLRNLDVVATFKDNDISAYSGKARPGYKLLLEVIGSGEVDVVLAWHTDRLHRSPRELEHFITISEASSVQTLTVQAGELDLATASGRMIARMLGAAARHESEQKSERIRRARQQEAEAGRPNGSLGYGYNSDRSINTEQASVIRDAAKRILRGDTLYAVATDLNFRGVPSPRNRPGGWRSANLRGTITRATVAGWREWRPGTSSSKGGYGLGEFLAPGDWKPILSRKTVEQLRANLFDPSRPVVRRPPENLLTGILVCGHCGRGLNGSSDTRRKSDARRYRCIKQPGDDHCGRISIVAEPVELMVVEAALTVLTSTRLSRARSAVPQGQNGHAELELRRARQARDELAAERAKGEITGSEWATMRRVLTERIENAEREISFQGNSLYGLANVPDGPKARDWWAQANTAQRRVVLKTLIKQVSIGPARPTSKFEPERVGDPVWRI